MTQDNAQNKAEELVNKFYPQFDISWYSITTRMYSAKQCALIAVNLILDGEPSEPSMQTEEADWENVITYRKAYSEAAEFWIQVKEAIEQM